MKINFDFKGRGRMIFALLGGVVFIVLQAIFPDLPFSEEQSVLMLALIGSYILGEGISGTTINDNLGTMLKSQKFQALIAGMLMNLVKGFFPTLGLSDADLTALVAAIMAFIVGSGATSAVDGAKQAGQVTIGAGNAPTEPEPEPGISNQP